MSIEKRIGKTDVKLKKTRAIKAVFLSNTHKVLVVYFLALFIFLTFVFPSQFIDANKNLSNDIMLSIKTSLSRIFSTVNSQYRLLADSEEMIDAVIRLKEYSDAEEKNTIEMLTMYSDAYETLSKYMAETSFRYNDVISNITFVIGELEIQSGEKYSIKEFISQTDKNDIIFSGTNMMKDRYGPIHEYFLKFPLHSVNGEFLGSVCFFINSSQHNLIFRDSNIYIINNKDNSLMFYNNDNKDDEIFKELKSHLSNVEEVKNINGKRYYFTKSNIDLFDWTVINAISVENFFAMTSQINRINILLFVFLYFVVIIPIHMYSGIFSQRISKIIHSLNEFLQRKKNSDNNNFRGKHSKRYRSKKWIYTKIANIINRYSLRKASVIFNTVIILIPILCVSTLIYVRSSVEADREFAELMNVLSKYNKYSIENTLNDYNHIVRSVLTSESLKEDLKTYSEITDKPEKLVKYEDISSELNKLMVNNMFFDFNFYDVDGNLKFSWPFENFDASDNMELGNVNVAVKNERTQKYIYNIMRKMTINSNKQVIGYGVVGIEEDFLAGSLNKIRSFKSYYFSDSNDKIFLSGTTDALGKDMDEYTSQLIGNKYCFFEEIPESHIKMCTIFSDIDLNLFHLKIFLNLLILTVIIYIIVILGTNKAFNYILDTITMVKESLKNDENPLVKDKKGDELDDLVDAVSEMKHRVKTLIDEVYVHKINEKDLELKAIQAQITPHFLYNTLEIISALVDMGDERASDLILLLSRFLRQGISRGQRMITIEEEIEYTNLYLEMQHLILEDCLCVNWDVKDDLKHYKTENFVFQPIIENILKHGQYAEEELRLISIKVYSAGDYIKIAIKDNGKGMDKDELEELRDYLYDKAEVTGRIGVKNIHERLRIHFGESTGVRIYSAKNRGTIVQIKIPKIQ